MREIRVILFGLGRVGRALVEEARRAPFSLKFVGVFDSTGGAVAPNGLSDRELQELVDAKGADKSIASLPGGLPYKEAVAELPGLFASGPGVLLDLTAAGDTLVPLIRAALDAGWGAVLANKLPLVGPLDLFREFTSTGRLRYEATVGAGTPVIALLEYLLNSGDVVKSIQGMVSGTLGYLLAACEGGMPLSQAVREAWEKGYTEPHPAQDLLGLDIARKALILARTLGLPVELHEIKADPLCSADLADLPPQEFLAALARDDGELARRIAGAKRRGRTLRYLLRVGEDGCWVGLREVEMASLLARARGNITVLEISTERFGSTPLVVYGPGSGPRETACGVLADIGQLRARLGQR